MEHVADPALGIAVAQGDLELDVPVDRLRLHVERPQAAAERLGERLVGHCDAEWRTHVSSSDRG